MQRRRFFQLSLASVGAALLSGYTDGGGADKPVERDGRTWLMPEDGKPHERTWLAFAADEKIWGAELVPEVQPTLL